MPTTSKDRYHHGDLRNALVGAAVAVAREGGPDAVVVRDVARQVGVSHNAGYRHFASRDDLLQAVAEQGLVELAQAMEDALAALPPMTDPAEAAGQRLEAVGRGYVRYALDQPGMFRTMWVHGPPPASQVGDGGPYQLLGSALDDLVVAGVLDPARRPHSEVAAWSAVHGLSTLLVDGPLQGLPLDELEAAMARLFDLFRHGITG